MINLNQAKKKPSKLKFNIIRFVNFMKIFLRNKRAALGLAIILFFAFIAVCAPLLTPFDPLGNDPRFEGYIAAKYAAPDWLKYLPPWLGGNPYLSENFEVVKDAGAPKIGKELNSTELNPELTEVYYANDVGYPFKVYGLRIEPKPGSLAVKYARNAGIEANGSKVYVYSSFHYPYMGNPGVIIGNVEFLINGSKRVEQLPEVQWFIILISNGDKKNPKNGSLSLVVDNIRGLYVEDLHVAATMDITNYFGTAFSTAKSAAHDWKNKGYSNWWEWLNGTSNLPYHWDEMRWVISDGSLVMKNSSEVLSSPFSPMYSENNASSYYCFMDNIEICDPDLTFDGNKPDIVAVKPWMQAKTNLTRKSFSGNNTIFVESVGGFQKGDEIIIGIKGFEEIAVIDKVDANENSITLLTPLINDHDEGEPVVSKKQKLQLYENIMLPPNSRKWVLVKVVMKDVESAYSFKIDSTLSTTVFPGIKTEGVQVKYFQYPFDERWADWGLTIWNVYRRMEYLDVPVEVRVFFGEANQPFEKLSTVFPIKGKVPVGFTVTKEGKIIVDRALSGDPSNGHWIISRTSKSTLTSLIQFSDPREVDSFFPSKPGNYVWGVEITFYDTSSPDKNVETVVYIDDFHLRLVGTSYGLLGTDQYGRDLLSQLLYGARISLYVGLLTSILSVAIGLVVGLAAGYFGGPIDEFLMRTNDLLLVLPGLPLLIVLVAILGAKIENLIILLGLLGWNGFARVVRSMVLSIKERPFIEAAKAAGAGSGHIIMKHIIPCVMAIVYVSLATSVPGAITAEAALSWLGFYDPMRMSWGRMLHEVFVSGATRSWWWIIPPGLCIALIASAFILLGYALDEILNPKLRMRM